MKTRKEFERERERSSGKAAAVGVGNCILHHAEIGTGVTQRDSEGRGASPLLDLSKASGDERCI